MASGASSLTHREYVDGVLVLTMAITTVAGYVGSVYWERAVAPRLFLHREHALERDIAKLEAAADEVCSTSKLFEHSRLLRRALGLRQELHAERRRRREYECSADRLLSPLLFTGGVSFLFRGVRPSHRAPPPSAPPAAAAAAAAAAAGGVVVARARDGSSSGPAAAASSTATAVTPPHPHPHTSTHPGRVRTLGQHAARTLRYNGASIVKYILRFGAAVVLFSIFGNRRGLTAGPPSLDETLHYYTADVVAPLLFNMAMYGPAVLFAPGAKVTSPIHRGHVHAESVGVAVPSAAASTPSASLSASSTTSNSGTPLRVDGAPVVYERVDVRLCASGDLISWFLTCLLASYLIVRLYT
ncbi:hypothetical protein NESM_000391700 [Novymonas esmeraldas]|uniref:Uncharacterized protein n=1 Tax=Novymonas esmeraldas TaxID=1808958 RepID=A0AAW0EM85_9TRYP